MNYQHFNEFNLKINQSYKSTRWIVCILDGLGMTDIQNEGTIRS